MGLGDFMGISSESQVYFWGSSQEFCLKKVVYLWRMEFTYKLTRKVSNMLKTYDIINLVNSKA